LRQPAATLRRTCAANSLAAGLSTIERGDILQTAALEIENGRVVAIYVVRSPDKLRHIADTVH
jgi:hypothetical protein